MTNFNEWLNNILVNLECGTIGHDQAILSITELVKKIVPSEEEIWKLLATNFNCKENKEDCLWTKCHKWGGCKNLVELFRTEILKRLEEEK